MVSEVAKEARGRASRAFNPAGWSGGTTCVGGYRPSGPGLLRPDAMRGRGVSGGRNRPALPTRRRAHGGRPAQRPYTGLNPEIDLSSPPIDVGVSHQHAVLMRQPDGSWAIVDPGSTNGVFLNDAVDALPVNQLVGLGRWGPRPPRSVDDPQLRGSGETDEGDDLLYGGNHPGKEGSELGVKG